MVGRRVGDVSPVVKGVYIPFGEPVQRRYIPHMSGIDRERLRSLMKERGKTPRALSLEVSDNAYLVRDILSGRSRNPRSDTLAKLAGALGISSAHLLVDVHVAGEKAEPWNGPAMRYLPVRYEVQAGHWREVDESAQEFLGQEPVAPDPRYGGWPQWLERVRGDSIDRKIPDGGFAHVVDAIAMGYAPRHNDFVVVERRQMGGHLRERTIKQVSLTNGHVELWPRSTNERWSEPLKLLPAGSDSSEVEVAIVGLVIGAYLPFT